jgi:hypothetical protein
MTKWDSNSPRQRLQEGTRHPRCRHCQPRLELGRAFAWCTLRPQPAHMQGTTTQHHPPTRWRQCHPGPWRRPYSNNCHDQSVEQAPSRCSMPHCHPLPWRPTPPRARQLLAGGFCLRPMWYAATTPTMGAIELTCRGPTGAAPPWQCLQEGTRHPRCRHCQPRPEPHRAFARCTLRPQPDNAF